MSDFTFRDPLTGIIRFNDANVIHIGYEPSSEDITITAQNDETGTSKTITANMSGGGGSAVLGQKTITVNGTYDASDDGLDGYDQVTVNVPSSGDDYLEKRLKNQLIAYQNNNVSGSTPKYMFYEASALKTLTLPNITTIETNGLYKTGLEIIKATDFPKAFYIGDSAVRQCTSLTSAVFPLGRQISNNAFSYNTALTVADFGANNTASIGTQVFAGDTLLSVLVLRDREFSLGNINSFSNTPFASDGTGGDIYVPSSLVSQYEQATNWSVLNATFKAIEGSYYETHYADGSEVTP